MNTKLMKLGNTKDDRIKDIQEMGLEEAYNYFILLIPSTTKEYNQARYGINIKFDIYEYFRGNLKIYQKKGIVVIHKQIIKLDHLYTELENRTKIIKKMLLEAMGQENEITTMRGIEQIMKEIE